MTVNTAARRVPAKRDHAPDVEKRAMRASQLPTSRRSEDPTARAAATQPTRAPPGTADGPIVLGRYRLCARLGAGAFGTVWHARDERLERDVAVKILPRERIVGGRFEREAKAAARLAHPAIVTLYEAAVDDDGAYLVSELVRGGTLAELLRAGRLSDRDVVAIGIALCDALEHAHAHGVVHRDVKPSNILVPARAVSPAQPAKLTDFGVARVVGGDSLTRTGDVVGTMAYMAPEQAEGREAGDAADLYSTALVIYEALTGVNPVLTGTVAVRARRLGAYLPPLRRQRRELPRELGQAIDLALRPRPRERGTVKELRAALAVSIELVDDTPGVVSSPWPSTLTRTPRHDPDEESEFARSSPSPSRSPSRPPAASAQPSLIRGRWPVRALGATASAALTAWVGARLLAPAPIAPAAMALLAGLLVLALPRVGWLALLLGVCGTALLQGHPGLALVLLGGGLVPVLLLPRGSRAWALPALCPALGVIGLAGAWPALASWAGAAWRRAALGAAGWIWLLLASPLTGQALYLRRPSPGASASAWMASVQLAAQHVLGPILDAGLLAPAAVWAAGSAALPLIGRRRPTVILVLIVTTWAAGVAIAAAMVLKAATGGHGLILVGEAVLGAVASGVAALAPDIARGRCDQSDAADADPQLA